VIVRDGKVSESTAWKRRKERKEKDWKKPYLRVLEERLSIPSLLVLELRAVVLTSLRDRARRRSRRRSVQIAKRRSSPNQLQNPDKEKVRVGKARAYPYLLCPASCP
jgi:hypothetical protein